MTSDIDVEAFLAQDLSGLDFSQFKPTRFEFQPKDKSINLRIPGDLLTAVQDDARRQGIPYQRYIRLALERAVAAQPKPAAGKKAAQKR